MFLDEEPRWNYSLVIPITNPPASSSKRRILERPQLHRDIMPLSFRGSSSVPCLIATALILLFLISPVMLMRWKPSSSYSSALIFPFFTVTSANPSNTHHLFSRERAENQPHLKLPSPRAPHRAISGTNPSNRKMMSAIHGIVGFWSFAWFSARL